jgi:hypothetical protein
MRVAILALSAALVAGSVATGAGPAPATRQPPLAWVRHVTPTEAAVDQVFKLASADHRAVRAALGSPDRVTMRKDEAVWWYRCGQGVFRIGFRAGAVTSTYYDRLETAGPLD